jgi:transposase
MMEAYDGWQVVGMDLHRRRSVLVRMTEDGRKLESVRIDNSPAALRAVLARAGSNPRVVAGATYGWYRAADVLQAAGAEVHLAHPLGVKAFSYRRVKNDEKDAADLADLLRLGRLPEARVRPAAGPRAAGADPVPDQAGAAAVLGQGPGARRAGQAGHPGALLGSVRRLRVGVAGGLQLPQPYAGKVASLRQLTGWLTGEIGLLDVVIAGLLGAYPPYRAVRRLPGLGPVLAAVAVAEIGDISRFPGPGQLCSWAGLTPRHRESDTKVARGHITKQGSPLLRWAMTEAVQHQPAASPPRELKDRITARRGTQAKNIAKTAAARKLLTCVFYAMRDGEVRSLAAPARALQAG